MWLWSDGRPLRRPWWSEDHLNDGAKFKSSIDLFRYSWAVAGDVLWRMTCQSLLPSSYHSCCRFSYFITTSPLSIIISRLFYRVFIVFSSFRRLDWAHISFYLLDRRNKLFLINISSIICLFDWLIDCVIDYKYWSKYHGIHGLIDPRPLPAHHDWLLALVCWFWHLE